jgi:hypothetical protein
MNFFANLFCFVQQAYIVNKFSIYPNICASWYFFGTGAVNLLYFGMRELLLFSEISKPTQVFIIYGFMTSCLILTLILYYFIMRDPYYKAAYPLLQKNTPITWTQYRDNLSLIKTEFILCFISVGLDFIAYPGVIFSIRPQSMFSEPTWNTMISLILGVADSSGKYLGGFKSSKCYIKWTFAVQVIGNVGILSYYFTN